jgi:hypothetical protein
MSDDRQRRRRNLFLVNGAGLLCIGVSVLMVTTGNAGWLSWILLGVAAVCMIIGRRLIP